MTEGILILNAEGVITSFSRGFEEIFGYGGGDVKGRDCSFLFAEDGKPECAAFMESIRKGAVLNESIARMVRKDGASIGIYLSAHSLKDTEGRPSSSTLVLRVRKTQTVPGILSEEFNRIFKFSNDAVAITDMDGNIIDVNQAFSETYGYTREEAIGKNPRILKPQHSKKEMYEKMWADILDPKRGFWRGEMINAAKDGREVPVLLSINAIKDEDGEIRNFLWIAYNMSRQKELDRIRKMYVDYVIHDIRGPLTTIGINSELLLKQLENIPEKTRRKITMIIESARKINDMTLDVLDFSRAQSGALPISKEKVDVGKLLRQALSPFENSGKKLLINGGIYEENAPGDFP